MKKYHIVPIALFVVIFLVIPLILFGFSGTQAYSSPEEYCRAKGYGYYQIVPGESSVFIVYQKYPSKVDYTVLSHREGEYVSIGYSIVSWDRSSPYSTMIVKERKGNDTFIYMSISGRYKTKTVKDVRDSSFYFLPIYVTAEEKIELCSLVSAYIGAESKDYYKNDYWYKVETKDDAN